MVIVMDGEYDGGVIDGTSGIWSPSLPSLTHLCSTTCRPSSDQ